MSNLNLMESRRRILLNTPHIKSLSGNPLTFKTDVPFDFKECKVRLDPVQDLHGYDHPWPAGGGKNLFDISTTPFVQGSIFSANGSETASDQRIRSDGHTACKPSTAYTPSFSGGAAMYYAHFYNASKAHIGSTGVWLNSGSYFTSNAETAYLRFVLAKENTGDTITPSDVSDFMLAEGQTAQPYSPYSNICPITGWDGVEVTRCGKNLFSQSTFKNVTWATQFPAMKNALNDLPAGTYTISYTSTVTSVSDTFTSETALASTAGITIVYNGKSQGTARDGITRAQALAHYSVDKSFTFTIRSEDVGKIEAVYMYGLGRNQADATEGAPPGSLGMATVSNIQIELGSTATAYEPYQGETFDITFPSEAGTVYGGTIDLLAGTLTVDMAELMIDGSFIIERSAKLNSSTGLYYFTIKTNLGAPVNNPLPKSDRFKSYASVAIGNCYIASYGSYLVVVLPDQTITTVESATEWFTNNPTKIVYELATPHVYQLMPETIKTLRGLNNLYSNANGNIDVKFYSH